MKRYYDHTLECIYVVRGTDICKHTGNYYDCDNCPETVDPEDAESTAGCEKYHQGRDE